MNKAPPAAPLAQPKPTPKSSRLAFVVRVLISAALVTAYYFLPERRLGRWLDELSTQVRGVPLHPSTAPVLTVSLLLASLVAVWWYLVKRDPRFHAPILITSILALGNASLHFLENHPAPAWLVKATGGMVMGYSPTFIAILTTILVEIIVGRYFWGKWPHLASAYISGISVGILIKSSQLWPFVLCALISILSKYVLRIGNRHLWNPTNFGVTMMLFLAPQYVASLNVQAGNNGLALLVIWILGSLIMYRLKIFHIPLSFVAAFIPLTFLRSYVTGHPWQTEIAPITSPMFQLFIFFMITDPKTTTRGWKRQSIVAVIIACMETFLRLAFKDIHSLYHCLFIVGPIANLIEMYVDRKKQKVKLQPAEAGLKSDAVEAKALEPAARA